MNLYHRSIYWLPQFDVESKQLVLSVKRLSNHLWEYIDNQPNHKHNIELTMLYKALRGLYGQDIEPFEVGVDYNNKVVKTVVRTSYNDTKDISMVIKDGFIVTCWLNDKCDKHFTLDYSKYVNKPLDKQPKM